MSNSICDAYGDGEHRFTHEPFCAGCGVSVGRLAEETTEATVTGVAPVTNGWQSTDSKTFAGLKPHTKFVGGKRKLADKIISKMPSVITHYEERFVGGGAVFWEMRRRGYAGSAVLSDINPDLIASYKALRDDVENLITLLSQFPMTSDFYTELRDVDTDTLSSMTETERAARFLYIVKTCYGGIWRVNTDGKMNVKWGNYKRLNFDFDLFRLCSAALQGVEVECGDFVAGTLSNRHDAVVHYFDSPYIPVSKTSSFVGYTEDGFGLEDQIRLRDHALDLRSRGASVILSNSDTVLTRELYRKDFELHEVSRSGTVNFDETKRQPVGELIIVAR